ncbi:MAG: hypothetical protein R2942_18970 [Ignavibacteria bacterium]
MGPAKSTNGGANWLYARDNAISINKPTRLLRNTIRFICRVYHQWI